MQRIKESPPNKKLSLIYLANGEHSTASILSLPLTRPVEIVQQSKIRKKDEFLKAYDPIVVEATESAYKGSSSDVQNKIRRVVEVWRQRQVFRPQIQDQIEAALNNIDTTRSSRKPALGGSLFSGSSVPPELTPVVPLAQSLQKADINAKPAVATANQEYDKQTNPNYPTPSPPMHAGALGALYKKLATAEGAVAESIKARQALISGLEKLLETNRAKLSVDEAQVADLNARKYAIEGRKREVEEAILKGLSTADTYAISSAPLALAAGIRSNTMDSVAPMRPDIEELTPPPMESFTPVGSPQPAHIGDDVMPEPSAHPIEPVAVPAPPGASAISAPVTAIGAPNSFGNIVEVREATHARPGDGPNGHGAQVYHSQTFKKRKMSRSAAEDDYAAFAGDGEMDGIDANVGNLI